MERKKERGEQVEAFDNEPVLFAHLYLPYEIFNNLNRCRQSSNYGFQPLQFTEIICALDFNLIDDYEFRHLYFRYIKAMDDAWTEYMNEQIKTKSNSDLKSKERTK